MKQLPENFITTMIALYYFGMNKRSINFALIEYAQNSHWNVKLVVTREKLITASDKIIDAIYMNTA